MKQEHQEAFNIAMEEVNKRNSNNGVPLDLAEYNDCMWLFEQGIEEGKKGYSRWFNEQNSIKDKF